MNNFAEYITPEKAKQLDDTLEGGRRKPLSHYKHLSTKNVICEICEVEKIWKFADTGMCFSCTTGETDASDDYELI